MSRWLPVLLLAAPLLLGLASAAPAEEIPVPAPFERALPGSVDDLREMQDYVTRLVPQLTECTVGLRIGRAQGSGVIVTPEGLVLTAAHVSGRPGRPVTLTMSDGSQLEGETLGRNTMLDASMIRIKSDRRDWPHRRMAEEVAKPGDWCLVTGHPGGYHEGRGVVLRLGRVIIRNDWMVQTDCELVGGDSGGPLFNIKGEIIGINTRIGERTDSNFHVPVETYIRDWDRMLAGEEFKTHSGAYLGVSGTPNPDGLGMRITRVYPGDPAARGGLKEGDVLVTFQGQKVRDLEQLSEMVGGELPGKSVRLGIVRDGEMKDLSVRLGMRWN